MSCSYIIMIIKTKFIPALLVSCHFSYRIINIIIVVIIMFEVVIFVFFVVIDIVVIVVFIVVVVVVVVVSLHVIL